MIAWTIDVALKSRCINRVIVSTEDQETADISKQYGAEVPFLRPLGLAKTSVPVDEVLRHLLQDLKKFENVQSLKKNPSE